MVATFTLLKPWYTGGTFIFPCTMALFYIGFINLGPLTTGLRNQETTIVHTQVVEQLQYDFVLFLVLINGLFPTCMFLIFIKFWLC